MSVRSLPLRALAICVLAAAALAMGAGCSDHKTTPPGKACLINSDCNNPLSCTFGKCHEPCRADGDCPNGGRCVWTGPAPEDGGVNASTIRVCVEEKCAQNSICPDPLVCGRDLECRNECEADRDCPNKTYRCVIGGPNGEKVCAEPDAVDPNGELKTAPDAGAGGGGGGGAGGGAGTGGAAGTGGSVAGGAGGAAAGTGGAAGAAGTGGAAGASGAGGAGGRGGAAGAGGSAGGAGGTGGRGGAAGAGGSVGGAGGTGGTAGVAGTGGAAGAAGGTGGATGGTGGLPVVPETEPNNDLATATPYTPGTQVMAMSVAGDYDYFKLTAPPGDVSGGYYQLSITNVGAGVVHANIYSATNNGRIGFTDGASAGESSFYYWAASPGQIYHVRTEGSTTNTPFAYTFTVTYTKIEDPYEPNNDRDDPPRPITLGQTVSAYFFAGYTSNTATVDEDWYSIDLAAGPASAKITNVASKVRLQIDLINGDLERTKLGQSLTQGSNVSVMFTVPVAGKYTIAVSAYSFTPGEQQGASVDVPDSFTRPYQLIVTQP